MSNWKELAYLPETHRESPQAMPLVQPLSAGRLHDGRQVPTQSRGSRSGHSNNVWWNRTDMANKQTKNAKPGLKENAISQDTAFATAFLAWITLPHDILQAKMRFQHTWTHRKHDPVNSLHLSEKDESGKCSTRHWVSIVHHPYFSKSWFRTQLAHLGVPSTCTCIAM